MKHILCVEKMKREKLHKVVVVKSCLIVWFKKKVCTSIYIKPIPYVEKDEKRKVAQNGGYRILFNCSNSKKSI